MVKKSAEEFVETHIHKPIAESVSAISRTIFLTGEITINTYSQVAVALESLNQTEGEIKLVLNSVGGEVPAGYAIYEMIQSSPNPVVVYGIGQVMSIASAILQSGHKRYMSPLCRFMIHNGSVSYENVDVDKLKMQMYDLALDTEAYYNILRSRSNLSIKQIKQWCDREQYMTAKECLKVGFIDGIKTP